MKRYRSRGERMLALSQAATKRKSPSVIAIPSKRPIHDNTSTLCAGKILNPTSVEEPTADESYNSGIQCMTEDLAMSPKANAAVTVGHIGIEFETMGVTLEADTFDSAIADLFKDTQTSFDLTQPHADACLVGTEPVDSHAEYMHDDGTVQNDLLVTNELTTALPLEPPMTLSLNESDMQFNVSCDEEIFNTTVLLQANDETNGFPTINQDLPTEFESLTYTESSRECDNRPESDGSLPYINADIDNRDTPPTTNSVSCTRGKRTTAKKARLQGIAYTGYNVGPDGKVSQSTPRPARQPKPRCEHKIRDNDSVTTRSYLCANVSDDTRQKLFSTFWELPNWDAKRAYIKGLVTTRMPRNRRQSSAGDRKNCSHDYYLVDDKGEKVKVCKTFFLGTLAIGRSFFVRSVRERVFQNHEHEANADQDTNAVPQGLTSKHNTRRQNVVSWLNQLPKVPSHYCRSSSSRVYVESTFRSISHMYRIYVSWCSSNSLSVVSRQIFTNVLENQKISIHKPRKDQCDVCVGYQVGQVEERVYVAHREKQQEAREAKEKAKSSANESTLVVTMDLQSVLLSPNLMASAAYYKTKLQVHNFTFYRLNDKDVTLYVWHEASGGVGSNEFVSCITDYITEHAHNHMHVILISDGCTYQNRNKVLSSALADLSKSLEITIEQLILEKGHTMMEADAVHSSLEKTFVPPIYSPSDYVAQMKTARPQQPYVVKTLDYAFFKNYDALESNFRSIRPGCKAGDSVVTDIRALLYSPDGKVEYKLRHTDQYQELPQKRAATLRDDMTSSVQQLYRRPLKIKKEKFEHLQQLKSVMPVDYHAFYDNLKYS